MSKLMSIAVFDVRTAALIFYFSYDFFNRTKQVFSLNETP